MESGDFDDVMPEQCRKLSPKDALKEFLRLNKVVVFVPAGGADQESCERLIAHFQTLAVTYAKVDLAVRADFKEALVEQDELAAELSSDTTLVYFNGAF